MKQIQETRQTTTSRAQQETKAAAEATRAQSEAADMERARIESHVATKVTESAAETIYSIDELLKDLGQTALAPELQAA